SDLLVQRQSDPSTSTCIKKVSVMLQETTTAPTGAADGAAALQQMGFADMIQHLDVVGWAALLTLLTMSALSIYWIIFNLFKNQRLRATSDRVINTLWET